ncbi:serine/threonine-protein kinase [Mycolicibacterium bacteremicum]|uniref:non-specific serine/threonine protein kinase n=1 Tax=Mycolicibacterium bacteremicum TaxID=564198 RepID=A0A1W9YTC9_MYCBA|nr:serine/threonine-protein kinase [Mycolicibacterium bacteremicum]MCV7432956.1 serine/threonine protein kinase [Mycolicibacterium bacteremicum]ORA03293.1 serine/threonine protein kinase [Mycolicibacterium bacteremicum]
MGTVKGGSRLGTRFGPYELRSVLGVGGMGEVYRAYDTARERMVAIKLLRPDLVADPSFQDRFRRESRLAARLQAPHIIPVHDFGEIDGVLYIDMRLVEGPSLKEVLHTQGALAPRRAVSIIAQVATALDAAHANHLVHRDIKPENILLTQDDFAYLVDFGIAHGGGEPAVTSTGLVVGSSAYLAPERFSGDRGAPAADIYSLACVLYEALTGLEPYAAGDVRQVWAAHMFSAPPRPSIMRRGVGRAFDDVIARGMAKDPGHRYATAGELARAAAQAIDGAAPVVAAPAPATPPPTQQYSAVYATPHPSVVTPLPARPRRPSSGRWVLALATIGLFAIAGALASALVFGGDDGTAPRSPLAVPAQSPEASAAAPTTSTTPAVAGVSGTDSQGFVGHSARCDSSSTPAALIRTAQSLAIICRTSSDDFYYRGERLRDGANLELRDARRSGAGFVAVNPADGARYEVMPGLLTISSNGRVDSSERALEYGWAQ